MRRTVRDCVLVLVVTLVATATAPPAVSAAVAPGHQVFTDPLLDGGPLRPLAVPTPTPSWEDLVAGYVSEDADSIDFTWEVDDIEPLPLPESYATYYWEFAFAPVGQTPVPCDYPGNSCVAVQADSLGRGVVSTNCSRLFTQLRCAPVPGPVMTVHIDYAADQITASVQRTALGDPSDGLLMHEAEIFEGIGSTTAARAYAWAGNMDTADLDAPYVVGSHRT